MNAETDVTVIIPNYNSRDLLADCLASLFAHPTRCSFEVIVVDDCSADGSGAMVRERFPEVLLRENPVNLGYARANNWAFANAKGRYFYMLNSDTVALPGLLDNLVDFLDAHPEVGGAGSRLYNADGSIQASTKSLPSIRSAFIGKRSWLYRTFPNSQLFRSELLHLREPGNESPFEVGYASSASLMVPREVQAEVGDLDTRLWHFIDADYCKRIWDTGHSVYCVPAAAAIHLEHHGGTMAGWRKRFRSLYTFHNGAWIYWREHSGKPGLHPATLLVGALLLARFAATSALQLGRELLGWERRVYKGGF